jgi:PadR family transcriptional regulator, regulatory protein PadR
MDSNGLRGNLDALVLAALVDSPTHGYHVIVRIRDRSTGAFDLAEGTVYPALHRLEAGGHLRSRWEEVEGRRRKIYSITAAGRRRLADDRARWNTFSTVMTLAIGGDTT